MEQKNLNSSQDVIDQTFRNILVSNYEKQKNKILFHRSTTKPYVYTVTEKGKELASILEVELSETLKNDIEERESSTILEYHFSYYNAIEKEII